MEMICQPQRECFNRLVVRNAGVSHPNARSELGSAHKTTPFPAVTFIASSQAPRIRAGMAAKPLGKSRRVGEGTLEVSSTALELNGVEAVSRIPMAPHPPGESPTPDSLSATPLPDDPSVLKENVKNLKSQLRRYKQRVLSPPSPIPDEAHPVTVRK